VAFQVQTKLLAVIVIVAFVAEPWHLLGLEPLLDYGPWKRRGDAFFNSLPSCLRFYGSIAHHLDPRFTVKAPPKVKEIKKATTILGDRAASPEIPEILFDLK